MNGEHAEYENPDTGLKIEGWMRAPDDDAPKDRAPVVIFVGGLRSLAAVDELADEVEAFTRELDLVVDDAQQETRGALDRASLSHGWEKHQRILHEHSLRYLGNDPASVMSHARLAEALHWNSRRASFADDELFVQQILFADADHPAEVTTFVAWADGVAARLPKVDGIQTPRSYVPWSVIANIVADARRDGDHWIVDGPLVSAVFAAMEKAPAAPPPKLVPPRDVLTKEIVDAYVMPMPARAARNAGMDALMRGRMAGYTGGADVWTLLAKAAKNLSDDASAQREIAQMAHDKNPALALRTAARAFELDPTSTMSALIAAANAMYCGKWDRALHFADVVLAQGDDRNSHLVRATVFTEKMMWDEALAACDRAIALEDEPMAVNVKAFTLAAAGRAAEAKAEYQRALKALDAALKESPDDGDLHGRRAYALLGLGRAKDALAAAKKALKIDEDEILSLQSLGRALVMLGKAKEALVPLKMVMEKRPCAPMAAFYAAKAAHALGDAKLEESALKTAKESPYFADRIAKDPDLTSTRG